MDAKIDTFLNTVCGLTNFIFQAEMVSLLNPSTDFYKKLALDCSGRSTLDLLLLIFYLHFFLLLHFLCSGQQIAVDLFVIAR